MRSLPAVLADLDLGHLRIVAELWGIELASGRARAASAELAGRMLSPLAAEIVAGLPPGPRDALDHLLAAPGARLPYAAFARQFGEIRDMGANRRDRERPWHAPASPAEALWYRGLVARAFDDSPQGPQEFIFVPDDLRALLPGAARPAPPPPALGRTAAPDERAHPRPASTAAVDDACTLLAYLQRRAPLSSGRSESARADAARFLLQPESFDLILQLLLDLGLVAAPALKLDASRVRPFLESDRAAQLTALARAWRESSGWNDLLRVPGLRAEGTAWRNDPVVTRRELLGLLGGLPRGEWWSLESFVAAVKAARPDFQRPAGDYDSWYIRDARTGDYLRGFEHWDRVDGALVGYLIAGPLHWLGATDLAAASAGADPTAFRLSKFSPAVLAPDSPPAIPEPPARLRVLPGGRIAVPRALGRYERFQVARFAEWVGPPHDDVYSYRLSPSSLARAGRQGVKVRQVLAFLRKSSATPISRTLETALARFESHGGEASIQSTLVLKAKSAEVLGRLRQSPKTRRYLGQALGELAVEVRRSDWGKLVEAAAEAGVLLDVEGVD